MTIDADVSDEADGDGEDAEVAQDDQEMGQVLAGRDGMQRPGFPTNIYACVYNMDAIMHIICMRLFSYPTYLACMHTYVAYHGTCVLYLLCISFAMKY